MRGEKLRGKVVQRWWARPWRRRERVGRRGFFGVTGGYYIGCEQEIGQEREPCPPEFMLHATQHTSARRLELGEWVGSREGWNGVDTYN